MNCKSEILHLQSAIPRLADFGLAQILTQAGLARLSSTKEGTIVGTPAYMPPEQAGASDVRPGPYSDVYSLGAIFYALLTGRPPFDAGGFMATLLQVRSAEPPPRVRSLCPDVPGCGRGSRQPARDRVNGVRVTRAALRDGDRLEVARQVFQLSLGRPRSPG